MAELGADPPPPGSEASLPYPSPAGGSQGFKWGGAAARPGAGHPGLSRQGWGDSSSWQSVGGSDSHLRRRAHRAAQRRSSAWPVPEQGLCQRRAHTAAAFCGTSVWG